MERFKLNNTQDIDVLKQKLAAYKHMLETLKSGDVVEDYLLMKNESYGIKKQVSILEGEVKTMKERQDLQITEYEKQVETIAIQVDSVNETLGNLKEDVALLTGKVNKLNFNDLLIKIANMIHAQNDSSKDGGKEIKILKEEITQLKKQLNIQEQLEGTPIKKSIPKLEPSSYNQLKDMIQSPKNIDSSLNPERRMITSYIDKRNPLQHYRQFNPAEVIKIHRERNHKTTMDNIAPQKQMKIKKAKKMNKMINNIDVLNSKKEFSQTTNKTEIEEQDNRPQVNYEQTTFNQNPARSTSNETLKHTEPQKNVSEISNDNLDDVQKVVYEAPVEQSVKTEESEIQPIEKELKQTSYPTEAEQIFSDEGHENKVEEKPSFFSFLQRSKFFGK